MDKPIMNNQIEASNNGEKPPNEPAVTVHVTFTHKVITTVVIIVTAAVVAVLWKLVKG